MTTNHDFEKTLVFEKAEFLENCQSLKALAEYQGDKPTSVDTKTFYGTEVILTPAGEFEASWQTEMISYEDSRSQGSDQAYSQKTKSYYAKNKYDVSVLIKRVAEIREHGSSVVYTLSLIHI